DHRRLAEAFGRDGGRHRRHGEDQLSGRYAMDPITRASKVFLNEATAHWKARRGHVLFMEAEPSARGDLVKTLRLAEWDPACRRPLFLFVEAFTSAARYFAALSDKLVQDYAELQRGAAEDGVRLPDLEQCPDLGKRTASPRDLTVFRLREIMRAL